MALSFQSTIYENFTKRKQIYWLKAHIGNLNTKRVKQNVKKAIVLGASGFIGGHLVTPLKDEDFWVRAT